MEKDGIAVKELPALLSGKMSKHWFVLSDLSSFFGPASARSYKIGVVGNNWLVGWLVSW